MLALPGHATVQVDAIRLLRRAPSGDRLYLIPTTGRAHNMTPSPECLRTLTPPQREREAMLQRRASEYARQLHLTVYALGHRSAGSAASFDLDAYRHGRAAYGTGGRRLTGMAPDGVASVEVRFRDGTRVTVPVQGNAWIVTAPHASERPRAVLWRAADGHVMRRLR
jgi:hypothetical protein